MFITQAFAETAAAAPMQQAGLMEFLMPLVIVIAIFYLLVWRPQGKRMKAHEEMVLSLNKGDKVITTGGIHASVVKKLDDTSVLLEIAEGVQVTLNIHSVTALVEKAAEKPKSSVTTKTKTTKKSTSKKTASKGKKAA